MKSCNFQPLIFDRVYGYGNKVVKGRTPDKEDINVLVLDSEGLGALDEDSNHDVRIFSLAILLSSYFIYNSMGSIDENALQSLSLVVQLTKHIQIKSNGMSQDVDPEEYSKYFPSFMWVVRDFSLQLVDSEGESITSKDYLDKALHEQKGFSESAEQKNRIRRLLRCFFKERDCCTVVRPSTKEEDLQNLETCDFESLRAEFRSQISSLRAKVMKRIKPKTLLGGPALSGPMFADLVTSYVTAINKGAVPNIENAWTYISKGECQKALEKAYESFCEDLTSSFEMHAPLFEYDLKNMYKEAKNSAMTMFAQNSVGDVSEQYRDDLKAKMKERYSQIRAENEKITKTEAGVFLQNFFAPIEDKLRNQEYANFHQYEQDVGEIEAAFMDRGPCGPNREAICKNYVINALTDGAAYFLRTTENELKLQTTLGKEAQEKLEARVLELKSDLNQCKDDYEGKMRSSENEKAQLIAKEQAMRESLADVKKEKESAEQEWKARLQTEKAESHRLVEEYKGRMVSSEENAKESQRRMMATESESDKQKALLEQKVEFLEKSIETSKQKEKDYQTEIKNQKKELTSSLKESNSKYEEKINELNKKLDDAQDEITEKDNKISELEQKNYVSNSTISEKDIELKNLRSIAAEIEKLKEENENLKQDLEENQKTFNSELQEERDSLKLQCEELKLELSRKINEFSTENNKMEKEFTIQQQKYEFLETQLRESQEKLEENRKTHESMLKAVQNRETEKEGVIEEADKKIEQIKQEHIQEMKDLEERFETTNKKLSEELEKLRKSEGDAKMQLKLHTTDATKEIANLTEALEKAQKERDQLSTEAKDLEQSKQTLVQHTEERYRSQVDKLERDLEEKNIISQTELEEQQKKFEEDLAQLKSFYEIEKEGLKKKIQDEKNKGVKNVKNTVEDYEQRIQDEQFQHEEELDMLQDELRDKSDQLEALGHRFEQEMSLSEQKIQSLEQHLKETKEALDNVQEKNTVAMDSQLITFNKERKEMLNKTDQIQQKITEKEKIITSLESKNESLTNDIKKKNEEIDQLRKEFNESRNVLEKQIDDMREKSQQIADEAMQKKLEAGREEALTKQKIEFQDKKIEELLKALADSSTKYQEKLDSQKSEQTQEVNAKMAKIIEEKDKVITKFDEKKKAYKELEKSTSVKITKLEREKASHLDRIENLEKEIEKKSEQYKKQMDSLKEKIHELQDKGSKTTQESLVKYEELKELYAELEKERNDLQSKYDKDQALWKTQAEFIKEQKESLKNDVEEGKRKLKEAILQLQNKGSSVDQEKKQMDMFNRMEKEYKDKMNKVQESHEKYVNELLDKNKDLEQKNHALQEKYELTFRDSSSSARTLEKRLNDLEQKDAAQQEEISQLKQQRDKAILEHQQAIDREREALKSKISEIERKFMASESDKSSLKFEIEKQQARWNTEKDNFDSIKTEMQDTIARLEKRNENLMMQNERLKEKTKNPRKYNKYGGINTSSYLDSSQSSRFMAGKYIGSGREADSDTYSNNSGKENRFKTLTTKYIGDGKESDKRSKEQILNSRAQSDLILGSPYEGDKAGELPTKETESISTLSPQDDGDEQK